jgi:CHAD domain-containing protein
MAKAKLLPGLSADTALKDAATAILLTRSDEVSEQLKAFLDSDSATALHGSRTAVRRLRTAIDTLAKPLPDADRDAARARLRKVFKRLGKGRDLDVQLELIGRTAPKLRSELREQRERRYRKARKAAKAFLRDGTLRSLRAAVTDSLVLRAAGHSPEFAAKTLKSGADEILTPLTDELLKKIRGASGSDDPEAMHRLRLAVKKMRDALEMLQGALPQLGGWQKRLAALATVLGDLHDVDVLQEELRGALLDAKKNKRRTELERLIKHAETKRQRLLAEADARVSKQALQRLDTDLRNARAGSFFEDPSTSTVH